MNRTFNYLVLKALWVILRYIRVHTFDDRLGEDATITMMQVGRYADKLLDADKPLRDYLEQ